MAINTSAVGSSDPQIPLLARNIVDGAIDYKGRPAIRSKYGRWRSAPFIIGVEMAERIAYFGIGSNLISYLTGPLGQSIAVAAEYVNAWIGVSYLLPLLGAVVADSFLGRYRTIAFSSLVYVLGLGLLTVSAMMPSIKPSACENIIQKASCSPYNLQEVIFFFALYLVAIGQGGHKPCVQAFGADQFDGQDEDECKERSSFFNWWYFGLCIGPLLSRSILTFVQDNLSWSLGFGIPCIIMVVALVVFLLGSRTYRYNVKGEEENPFLRIGKVFASAARNWRSTPPSVDVEQEAQGILLYHGSQQFKFLDKALLTPHDSKDNVKICSTAEVEEAKAILRLFPIWATSLVYAIVFAQPSTFFTKQGATMDRSIGTAFSVPAASLQAFISLSAILFIPIYDRIFVPVARALTGNPSGITMLQRIGAGLFISIISMIVAALVELKRLETAFKYKLIDLPEVTVPMSVWWLVPQDVLLGIANVFTIVGLQEFFYDQVPKQLKSVGLSLYMSIIGIGSLLSSCAVSFINGVTTGDGRDSWFADNLNRAHLDYFYWLLAGLSAVGLALFIYFAKSYVYNGKSSI
ncbi:hypothetical protein Nepgr_002186 [Nepenthes gracilis]|uniref:Uncharacterized protein n=1 Tax=Nepenthes gracilis TaxID=150966 RepID=A0AAD3RWN2_NEPGR|nr:hypothetical protein Nepgr_002186 [Nepenthes gracilis]